MEATILLIISGIKALTDLGRNLIDRAKQTGELTPAAEAAWKAHLDEYRKSPAGTPTDAGKL